MSSVMMSTDTKLGAMKLNKRHHLEHGIIEYLSSMVVAAIVLYAGMTLLVKSVKMIITPEKSNYSIVALTIIVVAIFIELIHGQYVKNKAKNIILWNLLLKILR